MDNKKIKVVYFAGSGRSGSTILNIILGNHPKIFGGGELQNMRKVYNKDKICSCQSALVDCKLWSSVMKDWLAEIEDDTIDSGLKKWNRFQGVFTLKAWMGMCFGHGKNTDGFNEFQESTYAFYHTLQQHCEKEVIVDISKNPLRAWALEKNPNIDLRMVHLVRDGRAVTSSLKRNAKEQRRKRPTWRAALFWIIMNRMTDFVRKRVKHNVLIKYEDFISQPEIALKKIGDMSEIDFSNISEKIKKGEDFNIIHVMAGNAIRKADTIKFKTKTSDGWKKLLTPSSKALFRLIAFSSLRRYRY